MPTAGSTSRSNAHAAGEPRSAGERHRLGDGGAHSFRRRVLPPQDRRIEHEVGRKGEAGCYPYILVLSSLQHDDSAFFPVRHTLREGGGELKLYFMTYALLPEIPVSEKILPR